jgi:hypothetical protein
LLIIDKLAAISKLRWRSSLLIGGFASCISGSPEAPAYKAASRASVFAQASRRTRCAMRRSVVAQTSDTHGPCALLQGGFPGWPQAQGASVSASCIAVLVRDIAHPVLATAGLLAICRLSAVLRDDGNRVSACASILVLRRNWFECPVSRTSTVPCGSRAADHRQERL